MAGETDSLPPDEGILGCCARKKVSFIYCLVCNKVYHTRCGTRDKDFKSLKGILGVCSCSPNRTSISQQDEKSKKTLHRIIENYEQKLKNMQKKFETKIMEIEKEVSELKFENEELIDKHDILKDLNIELKKNNKLLEEKMQQQQHKQNITPEITYAGILNK